MWLVYLYKYGSRNYKGKRYILMIACIIFCIVLVVSFVLAASVETNSNTNPNTNSNSNTNPTISPQTSRNQTNNQTPRVDAYTISGTGGISLGTYTPPATLSITPPILPPIDNGLVMIKNNQIDSTGNISNQFADIPENFNGRLNAKIVFTPTAENPTFSNYGNYNISSVNDGNPTQYAYIFAYNGKEVIVTFANITLGVSDLTVPLDSSVIVSCSIIPNTLKDEWTFTIKASSLTYGTVYGEKNIVIYNLSNGIYPKLFFNKLRNITSITHAGCDTNISLSWQKV